MDNARFKARIYFVEKFKKVDNTLKLITSADRTLYSGNYKTKILADDLPDWYIGGIYYKRKGYMSAKGIIDMVYCPSRYCDSFLEEDILLVSFNKKIEKCEDKATVYASYINYDEAISGASIIKIIDAAWRFSGYDISTLMKELQEQKDWLKKTFTNKGKMGKFDKLVEDMFMNWC